MKNSGAVNGLVELAARAALAEELAAALTDMVRESIAPFGRTREHRKALRESRNALAKWKEAQ